MSSDPPPSPLPAHSPAQPPAPPSRRRGDGQEWGAWLWSGLALLVIAIMLWGSLRGGSGPSFTPLRWADIQPRENPEVAPWQWVVIHHSGAEVGDALGIDRDHQSRGWEGLGYHFIIGNGEGMPLARVEWSFRWNLQRHGAHVGVGDMNRQGIGICLIGNFDLDQPDPLQYHRAVELTALLLQHIPSLSLEQVVGHGEVSGARTNCTGGHFDMDRFRAAVGQQLASLPPTQPY